MDSFIHKDKTYNIKKHISLIQDIEIKKILGGITNLQKLTESGDPDIMLKSMDEIIAKTRGHEEMVVDVLIKNLGMTMSELEDITPEEAFMLFSVFYNESTVIKKKLEKPLDLPTSQTIQQ